MTIISADLLRHFGIRRMLACTLSLQTMTAAVVADDWPQFRGPGASGISSDSQTLPVHVSPEGPFHWRTQVPPGHSSPVVFGNRIFLTAIEDDRLLTVALDRETGQIVWKVVAPHDALEKIHRTGSHAQSSPTTDGEIVVSFFGSSGLHAYDREGKVLWSNRMGPFPNDFGAGSSPVIHGDSVVLVQDHDIGSFIAVYEKSTGKERWRRERPDVLRNYATPVIWTVDGRSQIVTAGTTKISGYDLESGEPIWEVSGASRIINMTPVVGQDKTLYVAAFSPGNEGDERVTPLSSEDLFAADADQNGTVEESEFPDHPFKRRFSQLDRDKDGHLTSSEYQVASRPHAEGRNVVLAIAPGGRGDITKTHVRWEYVKQIPYCPSPLYYQGVLYLIKNGGILSALDAATGQLIEQKRLKATGEYYASPVAGDGKIFLISVNGELTVLSADDRKELHTASFDADAHATPALSDGQLFLRIGQTIYCYDDVSKRLNVGVVP